ncbi:MAG: hypothetical protein ONB13_12585, partial [candidate division KSB1 bacterium]|nr:hypothetical protein [candidate division KSB1 bacterium]
MNRKHSEKHYRWLVEFISVMIILLYVGQAMGELSTMPHQHRDLTLDFDTRLRFYLDLKTKRFLHKMAIKEQLLLGLIRDVTEEVQIRKKAGLAQEDAGLDLLYSKEDQLVKEYDAEIQAIKGIVSEIERLESTVQQMEDLKLIEEVEQLKDRLMAILDDQKSLRRPMTRQEAAAMIQRY